MEAHFADGETEAGGGWRPEAPGARPVSKGRSWDPMPTGEHTPSGVYHPTPTAAPRNHTGATLAPGPGRRVQESERKCLVQERPAPSLRPGGLSPALDSAQQTRRQGCLDHQWCCPRAPAPLQSPAGAAQKERPQHACLGRGGGEEARTSASSRALCVFSEEAAWVLVL